ncbi:MAG: PAS domain-containing protein [Balneolaceae bacterium]
MKNSRKEIKKQLVRNVGNYFSGYQEETLAAVYELARCSAEEGIGELEILNLYYDACLQLYSSGMNIEQKKQLKSHLNVLSEFFAPYDMRQRGFSDLIGQLKQQNQKLEKEVKRRKRSEEELIRSKRYFEQLIENALDIITVLSSDGRILYESPSVERILGYRPGNLVGRNVFDYIHREDLEEVRQQFGRLAEIPGRSRSFEFRLRHRDGRWRYIESIAKHVVDFDGESAIIVNSRDITDRVSVHKKLMEAHESLKKSRHKLVSAQRIALLGSWEWDITEDKLIWSDELCGIYGISAAEAPETYDEYLERLHPDDRELARKTIENASKEKSAFEFTYRIYRPDGSARILHARGDLVTDEEGRPVKMIGTGQDVTRMKEVENKLRIYSKELRNLSAKQNMIREEERIRVARVIHDELGQMLTVLKIDISIMMKRAGKASGQTLMSTITKGMDEFSDRIDTIIQSVQRITAELSP